jgi:DNA mismatch repair ATPase MutS
MTPMMQQYFEVKRGLPANTLLLFRLGDFYEMFFEDAEIGARLLGITLTKRGDTPMAGIPRASRSTQPTITSQSSLPPAKKSRSATKPSRRRPASS